MARKFSGRNLRAIRVAAGLKPEHLALLIGRSVFTVYQYERDVAKPSAAALGALADQLNCTVDEFYALEAVASGAA